MEDMNWEKAEKHLREVEAAYAAIGSNGFFGATFSIRPLRDRFNKGERSRELFDAILRLK